MSKDVRDLVIIYDAEVEHPFEPVKCKRQKADILIFRDTSYGSVYDTPEILLQYKYGVISFFELEIYGICVVELFHDKGLRNAIFPYCKDFFLKHSSIYEYEFYFTKYITNYKGE